jgi:hypothetical protein
MFCSTDVPSKELRRREQFPWLDLRSLKTKQQIAAAATQRLNLHFV